MFKRTLNCNNLRRDIYAIEKLDWVNCTASSLISLIRFYSLWGFIFHSIEVFYLIIELL